MGGFDDAVRDLLSAAKRQEDQALREWSANLTASEQGVVVAHLAFALLHGLLANAATRMRESGRDCTLQLYGPTLQVDAPGRQVVCTCMLQDDSILIDFYGHGVEGRREVWRPPVKDMTQFAGLFASVQDLSLRVVKHLVGVA